MPLQNTEQTFESFVEETLLEKAGWKSGSNAEWDKKWPCFRRRCLRLLQTRSPGFGRR